MTENVLTIKFSKINDIKKKQPLLIFSSFVSQSTSVSILIVLRGTVITSLFDMESLLLNHESNERIKKYFLHCISIKTFEVNFSQPDLIDRYNRN